MAERSDHSAERPYVEQKILNKLEFVERNLETSMANMYALVKVMRQLRAHIKGERDD